MSWTRTPRLEAVLRSIASVSCSPPGSRSAGNVGDALDALHALADDRRPFLQQIEIGAGQRVLIVGIALAPAGADILGGEHEQPDAGDAVEIPAQPVDHLLRSSGPPALPAASG